MLENKLNKEIKFSVAAILVADRELDRLAPPIRFMKYIMFFSSTTKLEARELIISSEESLYSRSRVGPFHGYRFAYNPH